MLYGAREGDVAVGDTPMHYVAFGRGEKVLIMIPGLSDGLKTVHGMAAALAFSYRRFAKSFRVYVFSRKDVLEEDSTTKNMAEDLCTALAQLGIGRCCVLGVSQGGMIAQHLAITHPVLVERLVLAVSASRPNEVLESALHRWMAMAEKGDYKSLMMDTCESVYSPKRLKLYRPLYPLIGRIGKPKTFDRFLIQARACLSHTAYDSLPGIQCPTLIIGGDDDRVVGNDASPEMASRIPGSQLKVYEGLGHGADAEAKDFSRRVLEFLSV